MSWRRLGDQQMLAGLRPALVLLWNSTLCLGFSWYFFGDFAGPFKIFVLAGRMGTRLLLSLDPFVMFPNFWEF